MKARPTTNKDQDQTSESRTPPSSKKKEVKHNETRRHWNWKTRKHRKPSPMLVLLLEAVKQCLNHQNLSKKNNSSHSNIQIGFGWKILENDLSEFFFAGMYIVPFRAKLN